jgi:DASH complex subunit DAD2
MSNQTGSQSQSSALQARINEKKVELESLKQLRDLSAGLAGQMQQLEEKLSTLSNGTEAVAAVMGNWNTVLRAVYMASGEWGHETIIIYSGPDNKCSEHSKTEGRQRSGRW